MVNRAPLRPGKRNTTTELLRKVVVCTHREGGRKNELSGCATVTRSCARSDRTTALNIHITLNTMIYARTVDKAQLQIIRNLVLCSKLITAIEVVTFKMSTDVLRTKRCACWIRSKTARLKEIL